MTAAGGQPNRRVAPAIESAHASSVVIQSLRYTLPPRATLPVERVSAAMDFP
jgi:hypothetical protein